MATNVVFTGGGGDRPLGVTVSETPDDVALQFRQAKGEAFPLHTDQGQSALVYVNPASIAYWREQRRGSAQF